MPFNIKTGEYSLPHSWTADSANEIPVRADRMDAQHGDIANSLTQIATGQVPFVNSVALSSGSLVSPSMRFSADSDTGFYMPEVGKIAVVVGGVNVAEFGVNGINYQTPAAAITTENLADNSVTTTKVADNSVTLAKLDTATVTPRLLPASTGTAGQTLTATADGAAWQDLPTIPTATESAAGTVTLATTAEAVTGTDTLKAVTSAGVSAVIADTGLPPPVFAHENAPLVAGSRQRIQHTLGRMPTLYTVSLWCVSPEHGYVPGEEILVTSMVDGDASRGYVTWASATYINYFWDVIGVQNTSADYVAITNSAWWRMAIRVW